MVDGIAAFVAVPMAIYLRKRCTPTSFPSLLHARLGDIGPILLRGSRCFLSGKPRWRRRFHKQPTLTFMPCVDSSHARITDFFECGVWLVGDPLAQCMPA